MRKTNFKVVTMAAMVALASAQPVLAAETFNGRSSAMGGAGVTVGDYASGSSINPALVGSTSEKDNFSINVNAGAMLNDNNAIGEDLIDALDLLDDPESQSDFEEGKELVDRVSNKPIVVEAGGGAYVTIPNRYANISFNASTYGFGGVLASYHDDDDMALAVEDLESKAAIAGFMVTEVGLTAAKELDTPKLGKVMYGLTLKNQSVETYGYSDVIDDFETSEFDNNSLDDSNFNVDFGLYKDFNNGWSAGLVGRDLMSEEYDTPDFVVVGGDTDYIVNGTAKIDSRFTAGLGYQTKGKGAKFALETDLNSTEDFVYNTNGAPLPRISDIDFEKQFVRAGVQFGHAKAAQLRLGYRHDLKGNYEDTFSVGLGLSPFNVVNLDIAATAGKEQSLGVAMQFGVRF